MEISLLANIPGLLWNYHRTNYLYDEKIVQNAELLHYNFQVQLYGQFRGDIRSFWTITKRKLTSAQVLSTIEIGLSLALYTVGRPKPDEYINHYLLVLFTGSVAISLTFQLLSLWFSTQCMLASHADNLYLLLNVTRLPIPSDDLLDTILARADKFESGDKNKAYRRLPFVERVVVESPRKSTTSSILYDMLFDPQMAPRFPCTGAASNLKHVQAFRTLQAYWINYDAYARICMSIGSLAFFHTMAFFCAFAVSRHSSIQSSVGPSLLMIVTAVITIYIDLQGMNTTTFTTAVLFSLSPLIIIVVVVIENVFGAQDQLKDAVGLNIAAACAFLSLAGWYMWVWFLCSPDSTGVPGRYGAAVQFLNLLDDEGICILGTGRKSPYNSVYERNAEHVAADATNSPVMKTEMGKSTVAVRPQALHSGARAAVSISNDSARFTQSEVELSRESRNEELSRESRNVELSREARNDEVLRESRNDEVLRESRNEELSREARNEELSREARNEELSKDPTRDEDVLEPPRKSLSTRRSRNVPNPNPRQHAASVGFVNQRTPSAPSSNYCATPSERALHCDRLASRVELLRQTLIYLPTQYQQDALPLIERALRVCQDGVVHPDNSWVGIDADFDGYGSTSRYYLNSSAAVSWTTPDQYLTVAQIFTDILIDLEIVEKVQTPVSAKIAFEGVHKASPPSKEDSWGLDFQHQILRGRFGNSKDIEETAKRINATFLHWKMIRITLAAVICSHVLYGILGLAFFTTGYAARYQDKMMSRMVTVWEDVPSRRLQAQGSRMVPVWEDAPSRRLQAQGLREVNGDQFQWPYVPSELRCRNGAISHSNRLVAYRENEEVEVFETAHPGMLLLSSTSAMALYDGDVVRYERLESNPWRRMAKVPLNHPAVHIDVISPSTLIIATRDAILSVRNDTISSVWQNPGKPWVQACYDSGSYFLLGREGMQWEIMRISLDF